MRTQQLKPVCWTVSSCRPRAPLWATASRYLLWHRIASSGAGKLGFSRDRTAVVALSRWISSRWQPATAILLALASGRRDSGCNQVSRATNLKDPQFVVIDEVAGQLITMIAVPVSWKSVLLGFILFRGFDIVKPPPVRQLEAPSGGYRHRNR